MKKLELKALIREVIEEMVPSEDRVDKSAIHKEMLKAKRELDTLLSYTRNGETLSGSYVADWKKVAEIRNNIQQLLLALKSNKTS